jgi:hypothetical protein
LVFKFAISVVAVVAAFIVFLLQKRASPLSERRRSVDSDYPFEFDSASSSTNVSLWLEAILNRMSIMVSTPVTATATLLMSIGKNMISFSLIDWFEMVRPELAAKRFAGSGRVKTAP